MNFKNKKILIARHGPFELNIKAYNCQEVGLAKELSKRGALVDIMIYSHKDYVDEESYKDYNIKIIYKRYVKIFYTGINFWLLKTKNRKKYDYIISSEYNQLMTFLLAKKENNVIMYNGPYYNTFRVKFFQRLYDFICVNRINKNIKFKFVKSNLAKEFLEDKGFSNIRVLGVGFDPTNFEKKYDDIVLDDYIEDRLLKFKNHTVISYIGSLDERKNFGFLIKLIKSLLITNKNYRFIIVGKGNENYVNERISELSEQEKENILFISKLSNTQTYKIYKNTNFFILPSKLEIFGMVLLEAMYCRCFTVASYNGGSSTLIKKDYNGMIIENFDVEEWVKYINEKNNPKIIEEIGNNAFQTINNNFLWNNIVDKIEGELFNGKN